MYSWIMYTNSETDLGNQFGFDSNWFAPHHGPFDLRQTERGRTLGVAQECKKPRAPIGTRGFYFRPGLSPFAYRHGSMGVVAISCARSAGLSKKPTSYR